MSVLETANLDEEATYGLRARWHHFLDGARENVRQKSFDVSDPSSLRRVSNEILEFLGRESFAALSADYERGTRLEEVVSQTHDRIVKLLQLDDDPVQALSRFSEDSAVRIMTIHKSKGLEFDTVVVLGVEKQTFWGKDIEERSAFFVGISRAKRRLWLTVAGYREKPEGLMRRWDEERCPHQEFLSYAAAAS